MSQNSQTFRESEDTFFVFTQAWYWLLSCNSIETFLLFIETRIGRLRYRIQESIRPSVLSSSHSSVYLPLYLPSIHPSMNASIRPSVCHSPVFCLPIHLYICPSFYSSVHLPIYPSIRLSFHPHPSTSFNPSTHTSFHPGLPACLSVFVQQDPSTELTFTQPFRKFPVFYKRPRIITAFTRSGHRTLS